MDARWGMERWGLGVPRSPALCPQVPWTVSPQVPCSVSPQVPQSVCPQVPQSVNPQVTSSRRPVSPDPPVTQSKRSLNTCCIPVISLNPTNATGQVQHGETEACAHTAGRLQNRCPCQLCLTPKPWVPRSGVRPQRSSPGDPRRGN
jgi:hypothetical protein